jgi:hypothetical protein
MIGINRAVVQRTWGLHELEARRLGTNASSNTVSKPDDLAERKRLTYGLEFKYDEFMIMPNATAAILLTIGFWIGLATLTFVPPVGNQAS